MDLEIRLQKGINPKKREEVFLHEVLHCIDNTYNGQRLSEQSINHMSEGLYQVLTDNRIF